MIVDDDAMVCATLASYVNRAPGLDLVGTCRNGGQAVDLLTRSRVDVVLMDVRMDVMDGITATRTLRQLGVPVKIIVLTTFDDDRNMLAALNAGANGFMLKDSRPEAIVEAINLEMAPSEIDPEAPLFGEGLGLDSIDILEIALVISKNYGLQIKAESADNFEIFSSLRHLARYIAQHRAA